MAKFKNYVEDVTVKFKGKEMSLNMTAYKEFVKLSEGLNKDLKEVIHQIHIMGEVPFLFENEFVMVNLKNGKTSPVKNRKQKMMSGVVINALVRTSKTKEQFEKIEESVSWDVPNVVLKGGPSVD